MKYLSEFNTYDINYNINKFVQACRDGNIDIVNELINDVDVNACDNHKWLALNMAALAKSVGIVKLLIDNGANVNALDTVRWTALMHAARIGELEIVKLLVDNRADINIECEDDIASTAIEKAMNEGHMHVFRYLLAHPDTYQHIEHLCQKYTQGVEVEADIFTDEVNMMLKFKNIIDSSDTVLSFEERQEIVNLM